jgi:hypothetical protein
VTNHPTPSAREELPPHVRADCRAAGQELARLERHGLRLRIDAGEHGPLLEVALVRVDGTTAARLAARRAVELLSAVRGGG